MTAARAAAALRGAVAMLGELVLALDEEQASRQSVLEQVAERLQVIAAAFHAAADRADRAGLEPYCARCGGWIAVPGGLEGWRHFRGDPAAWGHRDFYQAGHDPVPAWCLPPGRALSPAQVSLVRQALADAETYRMREAAGYCAACERHPAGACEDHLDDLDAAHAYHDLAAAPGLFPPAATGED